MGGFATAIYGLRNLKKGFGLNNSFQFTGTKDIGREFVGSIQTGNSLAQGVGKVAQKVENLDTWANVSKGVGDKAAKFSHLASRITNPLLVGAAAIRVAKDEDKKSALLEETCAMTGMFASERLYKIIRNTIKDGKGDILQPVKCEWLKKIPVLNKFDKIMSKVDVATIKNSKIADKLRMLGTKISKMSPCKQKALFVAAELGLVATSILSFSLFKKLGQKITGRGEKETNKIAQTQQMTPTFTSLTLKQV